MSTKENLEEKKRRYNREKIHFLDKFWDVKQNTVPEKMSEKGVQYKKVIKNLVSALSNEDTEKKEKLIHFRRKKIRKTTSVETMNYLSPNVRTILSKIDRNLGKIKNSITDITKMNGLFLEQKARKTLNTYRVNRKKEGLATLNAKEEYLFGNIVKKENKTFNKGKDNDIHSKTQRETGINKIKKLTILNDINNKKIEIGENKKDYIKNFSLVNDNYRKQLNFAFLKYNPVKNLENLKFLVQTESLIRKDISTIKKEVEQDIKWRCDKYHFKKKYEMIKKRFQRSNSVQNTPKESKINLFNKNLLPNLTEKNSKKTIHIFTPKFTKRQINLYEKKIEDEKSKIVFPKEEKIKEIYYMLRATKGIDDLIKKENITKKIDLYRTNYQEKMRLNEFYDTQGINLLEKDYFEEEKKNIMNKLGNIYEFQIDKNIKNTEKILKGKISNDNNVFNQRLIDGKYETLNEINDEFPAN